MKTSKLLSVILIIAILTTSFLSVSSVGLDSETAGSGYKKLQKLSKAEIVQLVADVNVNDYTNFYVTQPSVVNPYSRGEVRADVQKTALDRLNAYRRLAGLESVSITDEYTKLAQAAAVVNAANNKMSHYPEKPADMPADLYQDGHNGADESNLACYMGYRPQIGPLAFSVDMWMEDSDDSNIDRLGHRRWALNPTMKYTGFGCATSTDSWVHTTMYAFDDSARSSDYDFISWPPSGYMVNDTAFFTTSHAWSISLNPDEYRLNDLSQVEVELEDSKGNEWDFEGDADDDGFFNIDKGGYGSNRNAIIFRPDNIEIYEGTYTVTVEGLKTKSGAPTTLTFEVEFFSAEEFRNPVTTTEPTTSVTTEPTTDRNPTSSDSMDELDKFLVDLGIRYDFSSLMALMYHLDFGGSLESWVFSNFGTDIKIPEAVLSIPPSEVSMYLWFAAFETEPTTETTTVTTTYPTETTATTTTEPTTETTTLPTTETTEKTEEYSSKTDLTEPPTDTPAASGDLNGDGNVTASDARAALRISAKLDIPTPEQLTAADVNGDGKVNASDARKILRVSAKLETL